MSSRLCNTCLCKHPPPTGRNCPAIDSSYQLNMSQDELHTAGLSNTSDTPLQTEGVPGPDSGAGSSGQVADQGATGGQDSAVSITALLDAVTALTAKVERLDHKVSQTKQDTAQNQDYPRPTHQDHTTIADLRAMSTLNARAENLLGAQATGLFQTPTSALPTQLTVPGPGVVADNTRLLADILTSTGGKSLKSPRDAPARRIVNNVLWPNHFVTRAGSSFIKYDELTLEEFTLGMLRVIRLPELPPAEMSARLAHLEHIMAAARTYQWPALRSLYATALEGVQYADLTWQFSFTDLKERELHHGHLLTARADTATGRSLGSRKQEEPCKKWNFGTCSRQPCPYAHVCSSCAYNRETSYHRAAECFRRRENQQRVAGPHPSHQYGPPGGQGRQ